MNECGQKNMHFNFPSIKIDLKKKCRKTNDFKMHNKEKRRASKLTCYFQTDDCIFQIKIGKKYGKT